LKKRKTFGKELEAIKMGIRYQTYWTNQKGTRYQIDICDDELTSDIAEDFDMGEDGFSISYKGDSSDIIKGVLPSSCTISMLIVDEAMEAFINDIANSAENRFVLRIFKFDFSSKQYFLEWIGTIVPDLSSFDDVNYPFMFTFNAIDGIGKLKDIDFEPAADTSFIGFILKILSQLDSFEFFDDTDVILSTHVNWYAASMFDTAPDDTLDPLAISKVDPQAYTTLDEQKNRQYKKSYDVLSQILEQWNARMFLADGHFYFIQINELQNASIKLRHYYKSGDASSVVSELTSNITGFQYFGRFSFFRPVKTVSVQNAYWMPSLADRLPNYPDPNYYAAESDIGMFSAGNGEIIDINGTINISVSDTGSSSQDNRLHFRMVVRLGNYFLYNDPVQGYIWTTSATVIDFYSPIFNGYNYTTSVPISITTPEIPEMSSGVFSFAFLQFEDSAGNILTLPDTVSYANTTNGISLKQTGADGKKKYSESSTINGIDYEKTLPDILTGDGPSSDAAGKIEIKNTLGNWEESRDNWTVGGTGNADWINSLLCKKVLALLSTARRKYSGTLAEIDLHPYNTLSINGIQLAFLSGNFNANTGFWKAELFEIKET
jgi:hypothetical protein